MNTTKFNETNNYQYLNILGTEGVYTSLHISLDTLPAGYHKYSLREGSAELFDQISKDVLVDHSGDFITKNPIDLGKEGFKNLRSADWNFSDKKFDFESYFHCKHSIDYIINQAEEKRDTMFSNKSQEQVKTVSVEKTI